jgi:hypothetical protein
METKIRLLPIGLLSAFVCKLLILGTTPQEMGVIVALASLTAGFEYFGRLKQIDKLTSRIDTQDYTITEQNKVIARMAEEVGTLRSKVTVSTGMKRVGS